MNEKEIISKRKKQIDNFLSKKTNLLLIALMVFSFVVQIYFFSQAYNQPLWWDEADYMATAKSWAHGIPYDYNSHRPPLFMFLGSIAYTLGFGDVLIKILLVTIPSLVLIFCIYLLGKEMYNEKIGLIAALLTSVSWTLLFWSLRYQPDYLSMCFSILAIYFMWKFWKNPSAKMVILSGVSASLGFQFKVSGLLVPMIFVVFILIKDRLSAFKNKYYYYFLIAFLATLLPYFIWSYANFGTPFSFSGGYSDALVNSTPIAWGNVQFFYTVTDGLLFILFAIGAILSLKFLLYFDVIVKDKQKVFDPDIFGIVSLSLILAFYTFYIRSIDDRWVFLWLPFIFFFAGKAIMFASKMLRLYGKSLGVICLVVLLFGVCYFELNHANNLISIKKTSYFQVEDAALWLKNNANKNDGVLTVSYPQTVFYSEMNVTQILHVANSTDSLEKFIENNKPKYIEVSAFESHPQWLMNWLMQNNDRISIVKIYFADQQQQQAILALYKISYNPIASLPSDKINGVGNSTNQS